MAIRRDEESGEERGGEVGEVMPSTAEGERIHAEKETTRAKKRTDPMKPTEREVDDHDRAHLPYKN